MKKLLYAIATLGLLVTMTGCCGSQRNWSVSSLWANRPTPVYDFFHKGDACNTCNPPIGQPVNSGTNYAPACESGNCGGALNYGTPDYGTPAYPDTQPLYDNSIAPGAPIYPDQLMNNNQYPDGNYQTQNYPPVYDSGQPSQAIGSAVQLEAPTVGNNTEIETPPMYGVRSMFN